VESQCIKPATRKFQGEKMLRKSFVVLVVIASGLLLSNAASYAQAAQSAPVPSAQSQAGLDQDIQLLRGDIRSQKKEIVAANMNLTPDEATKFWPIYDQYTAEVDKIGDLRVALIKEYASSYNTMTDAQANDFMKRAAAIDQQFIATRSKYVPIFQKVISAKKTGLWFQIDRRLDLLINLQLAANIPVVNTGQ